MPQRLFTAAKSGTRADILAALASGISVHSQDENGRTALHIAAESNNIAAARCLLEKGAKIDAPMNDNGTPLFDAVACGHDEMVEFLLDEGRANAFLRDEDDWSILHWAVGENKHSTVALLVRRFPDLAKARALNFGEPYIIAKAGMYELLSGLKAAPSLLTEEEFRRRIDNVDPKIVLDGNYADLRALKLSQQKGRAYIYLRKCVLDYRNGRREELQQVLFFLESTTKNKQWLTKKLFDTNKTEAGEQWGSGAHEWLERSLIIDVLKRSAGIVAGVAPTGTIDGMTVDWLSVQAFVRSPTKYLFYKQPTNSIRYGHSGAVKADLGEQHIFSVEEGERGFHKQLKKAFEASTSITSFIIRVHNVFKSAIISGKKVLAADATPQFVVDGTATNDESRINQFRREKLKIRGYDPTNGLIKFWMHKTATKPLTDYSASPPVDSESDDEFSLTLV